MQIIEYHVNADVLLQILIRKPRCAYIVIGITSFGKSCGFKNTPAIYTNVANYTSWIEDNVWGNI